MRRTILRGLAMAIAIGAVASVATAEDEPTVERVGVGDVIEGVTLADQHGDERSVDAETRLLLVTRDMDGGRVVRGALEDAPPDFLAERGALYLADIHRMPALITRLFALPGMRRRPYPMLLDREGDVSERLPVDEGRAALLELDALRIVSVEQHDDAEALRERLEAAPGHGYDEGV